MKTEIQITSKLGALLKCSIVLFILAIAICTIENINLIIHQLVQ